LAGGTAVGQIAQVASSPVISRLYSPADFGALTLYVSVLSLITVAASLRYEIAIPIAEDDDTAGNLLVLCLAIVLSTGLVIGVAVLLLGGLAERIPRLAVLDKYQWLLPVGFVGIGMYQALSYWAVRQSAYSRLARTKVQQSAWMVATQVGLGFLGTGSLGLMLGYAVSQVAGSCALLAPLWHNSSWPTQRVTLSGLLDAARRYRRFPLISGGSSLLNSAGLQMLPIFLVAMYGAQAGGSFGFGQRILALPLGILSQSIGQVYLSEASRLTRGEPANLLGLFYRTTVQLLVIGCILVVAVVLFAPAVFAFVFGSVWYAAGQYVQVLAPVLLGQLVAVPVSQTLNIIERQDIQLGWDASRLVVTLVVVLLAASVNLPVIHTIALYSATTTCSYVGLLLLIAGQLRRRVQETEATQR